MCLFQAERLGGTSKKLNQLKLCLFKANLRIFDLIKSKQQKTQSTQAVPIQSESSNIRSDQIETTSNSIEESIDSSDASPNPLEVISQTETDMNDQESN